MKKYTVSYKDNHRRHEGKITFTFSKGEVNIKITGEPYRLRYDIYKSQDGDSIDVILRDSINMEPGWIDITLGQISQNSWRVRNYESAGYVIKWDHLG